ncbi:putative Ankyrin repeat domain-containing protein 33B [Hypsibius exemplaris]|uniref:Ankyrin repeat domain-containing protein 33B n=1 Tax=Hypsibius exemplaris TaxID=2072580 RepID=A0A9X6RKB0_HYPEX|nr:putative Ankyrin repeat domain-containing protein 33B [Hypsibius exemplaris]
MTSSTRRSSSSSSSSPFGEILAEISAGGRRGSLGAMAKRAEDLDDGDVDGELDDDFFGTPEEQTRRQQQPAPSSSSTSGGKGGRSLVPCLTVMDACVACDEESLCDILRKGVTKGALNKKHPKTGRTGLAYACAQGYLGVLDILVGMGPILDVNASDNEGNTPLHLAAEAGHADVLSNLLAFFRDVQIDSRNHAGLTPLMKAAIQGRTNCAKILLFAGACPALRDVGRCMCATEWARLCGRHSTADIIERFPHTSCLLHPSVHSPQPTPHVVNDRSSGQAAQRLAYSSSSGTSGSGSPHQTPVFPRSPPATQNGLSAQIYQPHGSPTGLTVRRAYRAASEPNLQARPSVQLQLEQLQELNQQPAFRRKPSWIRRRLKQALGMDKHHRKSLQPGQINRFGSTPSLADESVHHSNSSTPFSCASHRNSSHSHEAKSNGKPRPPMIVPKVKIHHTDSQQDMLSAVALAASVSGDEQSSKQQQPEKKHKLDFKRVMMFRKRSSSTATELSSKKI